MFRCVCHCVCSEGVLFFFKGGPVWCSIADLNLLWAFVEGIIPLDLELTWFLTPISPKTPSDESINQGLVCAHMHFITRTQKDPDICILDGWMVATKTHRHAPSMKMECDYLCGWIKKWSLTQKSHPNCELQRYSWERRRRKMRKRWNAHILKRSCTHIHS